MRRFKQVFIDRLYDTIHFGVSASYAIQLAANKASKQYGFLLLDDKFFTPTLILN